MSVSLLSSKTKRKSSRQEVPSHTKAILNMKFSKMGTSTSSSFVRSVAVGVVVLLAAFMSQSPAAAQPTMPQVMPILDIDARGFATVIREGRVDVIVDIRGDDSWNAGHVPGATRKLKAAMEKGRHPVPGLVCAPTYPYCAFVVFLSALCMHYQTCTGRC